MSQTVTVQACVPEVYAFLVGKINVIFIKGLYTVSCIGCNLTNCIHGIENGTQMAVLYQPSFVMLPVNISGPWYSERGLQVWKEIEGALTMPRRFIGILIAGVTALITLVATVCANHALCQ